MLLKLFIIFIILLKISIALNLNCDFEITNLNSAPSFSKRWKRIKNSDAKIYRCVMENLKITIPNKNISRITGTHLKGYKNYDAQWLKITESVMNFLPIGFDNFFEDIKYLDISGTELLELNQFEMSQFPNLQCLWAIDNELIELKYNIFDFNLKLISIDMSKNRLKYIDYRLTSRIISRNALDTFSVKFYDNVCTSYSDDLISFAEMEELDCIHEYEIFCSYRNNDYCEIKDGKEFLGIEKTKIIGELESHLHKDENILKVSVLNSNYTKIHKIIGIRFSNLEKLEIHGGIKYLSSEGFLNFGNLRKLNLARNRIEFLNSDVFVFTPFLEDIDLSSNIISSIGKVTFSYLKNLSSLKINNNLDIDKYFNSKQEIENYMNLETNVYNDAIDCAYFTSTFRYVGSIYYCEVINPSIDSYDPVVLDNFYGLFGKHIDSNHTNINVQGFIAKYSKSTALDPHISYHTPNLKLLHITKSNLMYLHENNFDGFKDLQVVDLSQNKIEEVPKGIFKKNEKIIFVDFSSNQILKIYEIRESFKYLKKFKVLKNFPNFNNEFSEINEKVNENFNAIPKVYGVTVNCEVIYAEEGTYEAYIYNITCNDRHAQQITELRVLTAVISKYDTQFIEQLNLNSQVMHFLPTNISSFFPNLKHIEAHGKIKMIYRENFAGLKNLEELNLNNNDIEFITDDEIFRDNQKLIRVMLQNNKIRKISENVFVQLKELMILTLNRNECTDNYFSKIENLKNEEAHIVKEICGCKLPKNFKIN